MPSSGRRTGLVRPAAATAVVALLTVSVFVGSLPSAQGAAPSTTVGPATIDPIAAGGSRMAVAPGFTPPGGVVSLGALGPETSVSVAVGLASQNPTGLTATTDLLYSPGSISYHHFLTDTEFAQRYGASPATVAAAVAYFQQYGVAAVASPDRLLVDVSGPAPAVAKAFSTTFVQYRTPGGELFFSHPTPATLPGGIAWSGAYGLGNESEFRPLSTPPAPAVGPAATCAGGSPLVPCQIQTAYNSSPLISAGTNGTGYTIGIVDDYDGTETQNDLVSDLGHFTTRYDLPVGTVRYLYPVPTAIDLNGTSTGWGTEEALDLQWTRASAPGAAIDMTFAPNAGPGLYEAVDFLVAHQLVNVISLSWGEPDVGVFNAYEGSCSSACNASSDGSYTVLSPVLAAAAAEGIGVFVASGDCGAADGTSGLSTNFPASDPSVTGVGGTWLNVSASGGYLSETGWSGNASGASAPGCANQGGSGGGYSPFPRPFWQVGTGVPSSPSMRGVPDVSADARAAVAVVLHGTVEGIGGTSAATPMWAGFAAIADQATGGPLGQLAPILYGVLRSSAYRADFNDIILGNNGYSAGTGWDPVTGIGTPNVGQLVTTLKAGPTAQSNLTVVLGAAPSLGPAPMEVSFAAQASGGTDTYPFFDVSFGDGNASLARGGTTSHVYAAPGVYLAQATAMDSGGNLSVSPPVAIVVGGGKGLNVTLTPSTTAPAVGSSVTFTTTVKGGTGPYSYLYSFGDGTFVNWSTASSLAHTYGASGGFCATVAVQDSADPVDGGVSPAVELTVGGATALPCGGPISPVTATLATIPELDAPAQVVPPLTISGGLCPCSVQYVSADPYVAATGATIFRAPGTYSLRAYVNATEGGRAWAEQNVTVLPALVGAFSASTTEGAAPLEVTFTASVSGGDLPNAADTAWTFGDGGHATGASVSHEYTTPGEYVAVGAVSDQGQGNASEAFLIDVVAPANSTTALVLSGSITPAIRTLGGAPVTFQATATDLASPQDPIALGWELGAGNSAFGPTAVEEYAETGCLGAGTCPLAGNVTAWDLATGASTTASFNLTPFFSHLASALVETTQAAPLNGTVPLTFVGSGSATGVPAASVGWEFGDGDTAAGGSVAHSFTSPGRYTVTATATDRFGDWFNRTYGVTAAPATLEIAAPATATVFSGSPPLAVQIVPVIRGGLAPFSYRWTASGGITSNASALVHTYTALGDYVVNLTVTDSFGDRAAAYWEVDVRNTTAPAASGVWIVVGVAAGAGAALIAGGILLARRRRKPATPSPRPSEPGAPPGA